LFVTELEFIEVKKKKLLFKRNQAAKPVHGTFELCDFLPIRKGTLSMKEFTTSAECEECCISELQ
jgi:hypothetical protein